MDGLVLNNVNAVKDNSVKDDDAVNKNRAALNTIRRGVELFDCDLNEVEPREYYFHGSSALFSAFKFGAEVERPACYCGSYQHSVSISDNFGCSLHFANKNPEEGSYMYIVRPLPGCKIISQPFSGAIHLEAFIPALRLLGVDAVQLNSVECETVILNRDAFEIVDVFDINEVDIVDLRLAIEAVFGINTFGRNDDSTIWCDPFWDNVALSHRWDDDYEELDAEGAEVFGIDTYGCPIYFRDRTDWMDNVHAQDILACASRGYILDPDYVDDEEV